jgi:hypothetical protein
MNGKFSLVCASSCLFWAKRATLAKVVSKMQLIVKIVSIMYQNDLLVAG